MSKQFFKKWKPVKFIAQIEINYKDSVIKSKVCKNRETINEIEFRVQKYRYK